MVQIVVNNDPINVLAKETTRRKTFELFVPLSLVFLAFGFLSFMLKGIVLAESWPEYFFLTFVYLFILAIMGQTVISYGLPVTLSVFWVSVGVLLLAHIVFGVFMISVKDDSRYSNPSSDYD